MKLICDQCGAKYSIADEKVRGKVFKIRCKKCQNVIVVRGTERPTAEGGQAILQGDDGAAAGATPQDAEPIWYVVVGREQVGPLTDEDLEGRLTSGEISGESFVWQEGFSDWVALSTVDKFAAQVAALAPAPSAAPAVADDDPGDEADEEATQAVDASSIPGYGAAPDESSQGEEGATAIVSAVAVGAGEPAEPAGPTEPAAEPGDGTSEAGPSSTPFEAGGPFAADMGGSIGAAGAAGDLLTSGTVPSAPGGEGMFSGFEAPPEGDDGDMVGARGENSVLFSLKNLQSLAMGDSSAAEAPAPMPEGRTDESGLIDVRSLAGDVPVRGPQDDSDIDGPAPLRPAASVMLPMVRRRSNTPLLVGAGLAGVLILGLSGVVITLLVKGDDGKKPQSGAPSAAVAVAVAAKPVKAQAEAQPAGDGVASPGEDAQGGGAGQGKVSKKASAKVAKVAKDGKGAKGPKAAPARAKAKSKTTKSGSSKASTRSVAKKRTSSSRKPDSGDADIDDLLGGIGTGGAKKKASSPKRPPKKVESKPKKVAAAASDGKGRLTKRDIQKVVRASGRKISRCATRIPGPPGQKVKIEMRWEIRPNGRVAGASVLTGKFKNHSVGRCVLSALKAMRFPAFDGKPIKIGKYPFGLKK